MLGEGVETLDISRLKNSKIRNISRRKEFPSRKRKENLQKQRSNVGLRTRKQKATNVSEKRKIQASSDQKGKSTLILFMGGRVHARGNMVPQTSKCGVTPQLQSYWEGQGDKVGIPPVQNPQAEGKGEKKSPFTSDERKPRQLRGFIQFEKE